MQRGVRLRLADLSRQGLDDGSTHRLLADFPVTGIAIHDAAVQSSLSAGSYDEQLLQFVQEDVPVEEALRWLITDDARRACDLLLAVHDSSARCDGRVSLAVDPRCARDTEGTLHDARRLRSVVGRDNLYVGVSATAEGVSAIQQLLSEGISVDATNIYGLERVRQVIAAVLAGLEQAAARGRDLTRISAALSIRVADLDAEVARLSTGFGAEDPGRHGRVERGEVAAAIAERAGQLLEQTYAGDFWRDLQACGARPLRLVWDTTAMLDGQCADTLYVERLVGSGGVIAASSTTLGGLADHGKPLGEVDDTTLPVPSTEVLRGVERRGIQLDTVAEALEDKRIRVLLDNRERLLRVARDKLSD